MRFLIFVLLVFASAGTAGATSTCAIKETGDGFVALRAEPSAKSRLVLKLAPGDLVHVGSTANARWLPAQVWIHKDQDLAKAGKPVAGWIHETLVVDCD